MPDTVLSGLQILPHFILCKISIIIRSIMQIRKIKCKKCINLPKVNWQVGFRAKIWMSQGLCRHPSSGFLSRARLGVQTLNVWHQARTRITLGSLLRNTVLQVLGLSPPHLNSGGLQFSWSVLASDTTVNYLEDLLSVGIWTKCSLNNTLLLKVWSYTSSTGIP